MHDKTKPNSYTESLAVNAAGKEGSQGQTKRTDFPQSGQECPKGDGECKGLHPGMSGLLWDSEHEDNDAEMGRVAEKKNPSLYLETMEESPDKS